MPRPLLSRPFSSSLAAREREALCSLALSLGASQPTLCTGWTVKDLVVHLLVRERRPWAAAGTVIPGLSTLPARVSASLESRDLASLVAQLASVPLALSVIDPVFNGMEMFIHHEDMRRAQPTWAVRPMSAGDERMLWLAARLLGRMQGRRLGVPLLVQAGTRRAVLAGGAAPVVVSGPVSEIVMWLAGRSAVQGLSYDGPAERVEKVKSTSLAI